MKEDYDGAEPSPTSVSAMNLLTLAHLTGDSCVLRSRHRRRSRRLAAGSTSRDARCRSWPRRSRPSIAAGEQIVIVGQRDAADTKAMWAAANKSYRPFAVLTLVDPSHQQALAAHMPWIAQMKMIDDQATVYVCRGFACDAPVDRSGGVRRMSALVDRSRVSSRDGAWRRIILGGGRGNLLSLDLVRALGDAIHALESRARHQVADDRRHRRRVLVRRAHPGAHAGDDADGAAGDASPHQAAAGLSGRRPRRWSRAVASAAASSWRWRATILLPPTARPSAFPRSGWPPLRRRPRRFCRCGSARRARPARSSPGRSRAPQYWHDAGLLSMVAPQASLLEAAGAWFDAHLSPHSAVALSHAVAGGAPDAARAGRTGARLRRNGIIWADCSRPPTPPKA